MARALSQLCAMASLLAAGPAWAQSFVNGDLEGTVNGTSVIPPGWLAVPFDDPVCFAIDWYGATPDLMNVNGPQYDNGLMGNPRSGQTYVSGLHAFGSHHEGLMQTVTGFTVGCSYTIGLYQTVSKQINADALDPTGSWSLYAGNTLIGVTATTTSNEPAISINKPWERREMTFTATASTHLIKFMPTDDDAEQVVDGVRMGIDSVWIEASTSVGAILAELGNDTTVCAGTQLILDPGTGVVDPVWQDGTMSPTFTVTGPGTYWVQVSAGCGVYRDTIVVSYVDLLIADLGEDQESCPSESVLLDASTTGASYLWSDGSTSAQLQVSAPGIYWVALTSTCGIDIDSVTISLAPSPQFDLGPDRTLCIGTTEVLIVEQAGATYLWSDGTTASTYVIMEPGDYAVLVTIGNCAANDEVSIDFADCGFELELPNVFTPNGNGENDLFTPIRSKGIRSMRTVVNNRWGMEVFNTNDLMIRWNGRAPNGDPVPDGTYFYVVSFSPEKGDPATRTGSLTLLR